MEPCKKEPVSLPLKQKKIRIEFEFFSVIIAIVVEDNSPIIMGLLCCQLSGTFYIISGFHDRSKVVSHNYSYSYSYGRGLGPFPSQSSGTLCFNIQHQSGNYALSLCMLLPCAFLGLLSALGHRYFHLYF